MIFYEKYVRISKTEDTVLQNKVIDNPYHTYKDDLPMNILCEKKEVLEKLYQSLFTEYEKYKGQDLSLDLSRGKPDSVQLDLTQPMLDTPLSREEVVNGGIDYRNYGIFEGVPAMRKFFSDLFSIAEKNIFIGGNSSLQLMYDTLMRCMVFGTVDSPRPWAQEPCRKWLCVAPGYDRHFLITEKLGFELITIPMRPDGPDMDLVEEYAKDPSVKGIWCIPKYSNPTGNTYSDEVVHRLASMKCGAPDFRIFWDNAYCIHDIAEKGDHLLNIFDVCKEYGTENRVFFYTSTSKITFPGAGVAMMAMSDENLDHARTYLSASTIGYDKLNQLRHMAFLKNPENVKAHMRRLGDLIKEKFDLALSILDETLLDSGIAEYTRPNGGYFISLDVLPGTAKRVYDLMKGAGVTLTKVGATFPYGVDPEDKNLRLAPTYCTTADLALSCRILTVAVRMAAIEKLLDLR